MILGKRSVAQLHLTVPSKHLSVEFLYKITVHMMSEMDWFDK